MAEQEPQVPETEEKAETTADRLQVIDAQLAELDAQEVELQKRREELLEKKAWEADVWGANDVAQDGEAANDYAKYLESRPKDGLMHTANGTPIDVRTGRFMYEAQKERLDERPSGYYDLVNGIIEAKPDYESLGFMQLAREIARARVLNDPATEAEVRGIVETRLMADVVEDTSVKSLKPKRGKPQDAYELRYQERLADYEKHINALEKSEMKKAGLDQDTSTEGFGEKMKKWGASLKKVVAEAGVTKWAKRWFESNQGNSDPILDRGVDQDAPEEQKEEKRKENRRKSKLSGDAQAGASVPEGAQGFGAEPLEPRLEGEHFPRKEYEVKSGSKLIDLFRELGLDASNTDKKYRRFVGTRQQELYPNELRLDPDGSIRFTKNGWLSKPLQQHLERLRSGGES